MKRTLFIIAAIMCMAFCAAAQNPIRWRMSVKMNNETEGTVTLRALIEPGWHLYGMTLPENGPKPTKFDFKLTGVTLDGKMTVSQPVVRRSDALFGMELAWWDTNVQFTQPIKVTSREGAKVSVTVSYMGCDDTTCLPPSTQTLTYVFKTEQK